ncbi:MAG: hypothetical protein IKP40_09555 [Clostridia bacterium]|nr:hypothetical protein [Clostridia bacterium]
MRRLALLLLALTLLPWPVLAQEALTVDMDGSGVLTTDTGYICVIASLDAPGPVVLSVYDGTGGLAFQRAWTECGSQVRSDSIYLALSGAETLYTVTLQTQSSLRSREVRRVSPRLTGCSACSCGCPLELLSGMGSWATVTMLDLNALRQAPMTVALHAGGAYMVGTATFRLLENCLYVSVQTVPGSDVTLEEAEAQVALTSVDARSLGRRDYTGLRVGLGSPLEVSDAPFAAVYLRLTVSFSPVGLPQLSGDELVGQRYLWEQMLNYTASASNG